MKYIFLDVDGVLNNKNHYRRRHLRYGGRFCCENMPFNPRSLKNLRRIIDKTRRKNCSIIILEAFRGMYDSIRS